MRREVIEVELDGSPVEGVTRNQVLTSEVNVTMSFADLVECAAGFAEMLPLVLDGKIPAAVEALGSDILQLAAKLLNAANASK